MPKLGLTSVTFRSLTADGVIDYCKRCGLTAIEWGSDLHAPPGDLQTAKEISEKMKNANLVTSSYGSYYTLGKNEDFIPYLETAATLKAPHIRIWGGVKTQSQTTDEEYKNMIAETKQICRDASKYKIEIAFEYHNDSLTDSPDNALRVMNDVSEPNLGMYFQYDPWVGYDENIDALHRLLPYLKTVHMFNVDDKIQRYSMGEENCQKLWSEIVSILNENNVSQYMLFEFLREESFEELYRETQIMKTLVNKCK